MTTIKTTLIAAGALIAAGTASIAPASAASVGLHFGTPGFGVSIFERDHDRRGWHRGPRPAVRLLPPQSIRVALRRNGYRAIRSLDRRGTVYVARAVGLRGNLVQVTVNGYNGAIVNRRVIAWR